MPSTEPYAPESSTALGVEPGSALASHLVQFYQDDAFLVEAVSRFVGAGLGAGEIAVVIASRPHRDGLEACLTARGFDMEALRQRHRYVTLDDAETLSQILVDGWPDKVRFAEVVGGALARAAAAANCPRIRAFGEMVALLCAQGRHEAAVRLEALWNEQIEKQPISLLCAYPLRAFGDAAHHAPFLKICGEHSQVVPDESVSGLGDPDAQLRAITNLQRKALSLETATAAERVESAILRARLAAIVESSDDAIVAKSLEGVITAWNPAAERMFGWSAAEAVGRHITLIIPKDRWVEEDEVLFRIRRGEVVDHFETVRITKDGRLLNVSLTASPIKDPSGRIVGASKIARDVTEQLRLRAELTRKLEELAEADRRKDEFFAMLGHELRNPLSAVRNAIITARLNPSRRDRALDIARRQADQLGRLVDDLLDVARITGGRMTLRLEPVRLASVVARAIETTRELMEARAHDVKVSLPDESIEVTADPTRLEQVVVNVIRNAVKFTEPGGRIDVTVRREADQVVLSVRDNGIGIAPDMLQQIFNLFTQARRSLDRSDGGLGIGLTVVQRLVELHGGRVEARSDGVGHGAEFRITLPCRPESRGGAMAPHALAQSRSGQIDVLVVDDNADVGEGLMLLLELLGHQVRVVQDGPSALDAARASVPDIMLVDIGLPGMDGYELARVARQDPRLEKVMLVALTGYGREEDRREALAAGFDDHIAKPMSADAFQRLRARIAK